MAVIALGLVDPVLQFEDGNGVPYAGGTISFYATNTLNLQTVYSDAGRVTPLTNPVWLNAAGRTSTSATGPATGVYFLSSPYDYVLKNAAGTTIYGPITFSGGQLGNSGGLTTAFVTTNTVATAAQLIVVSAGTVNVTLPVASSNPEATVAVANNGSGTVTVLPSGADTVGMATSQTLNSNTGGTFQGDSQTYHSDSISNWVIL